MKNQKGITLVALIITIIVMLILAGVAISLVTGDDGVVNQAGNATEKQNYATAEEKIRTQSEFITEGENAGKVDLLKTKSNISGMNLEEVNEIDLTGNLLTVTFKDGSKIEIEGINNEIIVNEMVYSNDDIDFKINIKVNEGKLSFISGGNELDTLNFEYIDISEEAINKAALNANDNGNSLPSTQIDYYSKGVTITSEGYEAGNCYLLFSKDEKILYYSGFPLSLVE